MTITVCFSDDPAWILAKAKMFLASKPVLHNIILTVLHERVANPRPGRYWLAADGDQVVGVVLQSPLEFAATATPMDSEIVIAMVNAISEAGVVLPGVDGEAATAACFAGQWTEAHKSATIPMQGQRIYEITGIKKLDAVSGVLRQASPSDRELLISWMCHFHAEIGEPQRDFSRFIDSRLSSGRFWLWEDNGPVSMTAYSQPVEGAIRIQAVYTPPERRNRGYAGGCVGRLSHLLLDRGYRCLLYTDLGNPSSNSMYRRVGYSAVAEMLRYRFE